MDMFISQFHFLRPWAWILSVFIFFIIYLMKKKPNISSSWQKICTPELLSYLQVGGKNRQHSSAGIWLFAVAALLAITALAGPVWQKQPQPVYRETSALVIALDLSRSMDAGDIKPSRLVRAKQKVRDLLDMIKEGQTALIAFAGTAYVVTPLTDDRQTILSQLAGLTTDIMPKQGGNLDAAMKKALSLFQQAGIPHGQLLYVTDSQNFSKAMVEKFKATGHTLSVIAVGTSQGAPIVKPNGGFLTDAKGNIVMPILDTSRLQYLARLGGGLYHILSLDNADIDPILKRLSPSLLGGIGAATKKKQSVVQYDAWQEQGAWLLLVVIPLVLLGFRRGILVIVLCLSVQVQPVEASVWRDMWHTQNQQAEALMQAKQYKQAGKIFQNPAWKMAAHYRGGDYKAALEDFNRIEKPVSDDWYNKGNILARMGRLDDAISAYDAAIKANPNHQDAKTNKTLLENMKKAKNNKSKDNKTKQQQDKSKKNKDKQDKQSKQQQDKTKKNKSEQGKQKQAQSKKNQSEQGKQKQAQTKKNQSEQGKQSKQQQDKGKSKDQQTQLQKKQDEKSQNNKQTKKQPSIEKKSKQHELSEDELKKIEAKQAFEQTLRRIPDDPGGLLRRKFLYQYKKQSDTSAVQGGEPW